MKHCRQLMLTFHAETEYGPALLLACNEKRYTGWVDRVCTACARDVICGFPVGKVDLLIPTPSASLIRRYLYPRAKICRTPKHRALATVLGDRQASVKIYGRWFPQISQHIDLLGLVQHNMIHFWYETWQFNTMVMIPINQGAFAFVSPGPSSPFVKPV